MQNEKANNRGKEHPDIKILSLLAQAGEQGEIQTEKAVFSHIAECDYCQKILHLLALIQHSGKQPSCTSINEEQQNLIIDFVDHGISIRKRKLLRKTILEDDDALRACLHYISHRESMKQSLSVNSEKSLTEKENDNERIKDEDNGLSIKNYFSRIIKKFSVHFKLPLVWKWSGLYSVLSTALLLVLLYQVWQQPYTDPEKKSVYRADITFFTNPASIQNVEHGKVVITATGENNIRVNWPDIPNAKTYRVDITPVSAVGNRSVFHVITTNQYVDISTTNFVSGKKYHWLFSTVKNNSKQLLAEGRFVINHP